MSILAVIIVPTKFLKETIMGYWFGKYDNCRGWRKTPAKINKSWYTPSGKKIRNPSAYFEAVDRNGRYWEGNTGWNNNRCQKRY